MGHEYLPTLPVLQTDFIRQKRRSVGVSPRASTFHRKIERSSSILEPLRRFRRASLVCFGVPLAGLLSSNAIFSSPCPLGHVLLLKRVTPRACPIFFEDRVWWGLK